MIAAEKSQDLLPLAMAKVWRREATETVGYGDFGGLRRC
jgi:hypothetical protein